MNTKIKSVLAAASLLAVSAVTSHAQLMLNNVVSTFSNVVGSSFTTTNNGNTNNSPGSAVLSLPAGSANFSNTTTASNFGTTLVYDTGYVVDTWSLDRFGSSTVGFPSSFDFTLGLDFAGGAAIDLSLLFRTNLTISGTKVVYNITALTPLTGTFLIGTTQYTYDVAPDGLTGQLFASTTSSNAVAHVNLAIGLVPVPEPSTYALFGVVALMGVVAVRRFRSTKSVA